MLETPSHFLVQLFSFYCSCLEAEFDEMNLEDLID